MTFRTWRTVIALCVACSSTALAQTSTAPTVTQGLPAGGANAWPVLVTEDSTNTKVRPGDATNKAIRVNCVTGCAGGGGGGVVTGNKTNNSAAPSTDNIGALTALAGSSPPSYTNGNLVLPSVDLGGSLRTLIMNSSIPVTQSGSWSLAANQSVNVAQINGVTPLMGNGVTGTGSPRVTIASDNTAFTVNAAQSGTWTVQPGNTANTTPWLVIGNVANGAACCSGGNFFPVLSAAAFTSPSSFTTGTLRTLQLDADNGGLRIGGSAEHDAVGTTSDPVLVGGYASAAAPTDVSADGDAVRGWFLRSGAQVQQPAFAGVLASTGTGTTGTGTQRVDANLSLSGVAVSSGTGATGTGTVRTDSNLSLAGVAVSSGNGVSGTGVVRVAQVSDGTGTLTPRTVSSANNTGTCTSVTTSSTTVLASNASRKAYGFKAASSNTVAAFCKLGATATTSNVPFEAGSSWSQDNGAVYTGVIDCITASSTASVCVFEMN